MKIPILSLLYLLLIPFSKGQNTTPHKFNSKEKVGAILFDKTLDNPNFKLCDEYNIMEYYQVNPKYKEGAKSIRLYFKPYLEELNALIQFKEGIVTVRFIVNCEGDTDRYRVLAVNGAYKTQSISEELKQMCISRVKQMGKWKPGFYDNEYFDAYYTLSFKIRDGKIKDILP